VLLHAARSAITATAELLVQFIPHSSNGANKHHRAKPYSNRINVLTQIKVVEQTSNKSHL